MNEWEIYSAALEIEDQRQRDEFLDNACDGDQELRARIELLFRNSHSEDGFLEGPPTDLVLDRTEAIEIGQKPGDYVGPFKLLQKIGEGGMGVVFMAEQKVPVKRRVALKIIKPGMDSRQVVARFEAERQALAMMDHPNIARAIDVGTTDSGRPYFVMELVKGMPITKYCDEHKLAPRQRLELFVPVCGAIQHAHQKGIIHRDVKPSNILIAEYDNQAVPKIIDFGVAKALNQALTEKTMFTQLGQVIGTLEYMSPEQAKVNQLDIDTRSDIYSLGVLLYELLIGNTPFDRERLRSAAWDELVRIIREEEPPKMSLRLSTSEALPSIAASRQIDPGKLSHLVRGELDWIVMKALDKERNRRYETANGLAMDIQRYLHDEPVSACPPSTVYRFKKFARRNKAAMATGGLVAAALLIGLAGTTWQMLRAREAERLAATRLKAANQARDMEAKQRQEAEHQRQLAEEQRMLAEHEETRANEEARNAVEQAALAEKEKAIAEAVNRFLQEDLLGMADAGLQLANEIEPDPDIKLRTLLARAVNNVDERFADQPALRAEIQATLGKAFMAIGRYEQALKLHKTVHVYHNQAHGPEHPATIQSMSWLALSYRHMSQYDTALKLNEKALQLYQATLGLEHPTTLSSMHNLALIHSEAGQHDKAFVLNEQVFQRCKTALGPHHVMTLASMHNLAMSYRAAGLFNKALATFEEAMVLTRESLGADHPSVFETMVQLGASYRDLGRFDEALPLHEKAFQFFTATLGPEHPDTLDCMNNLALTYQFATKWNKALELLEEAFKLCRATLGPEHSLALQTAHNLAVNYRHAGRKREAVSLLEETLQLRKLKLGTNHPATLDSMNSLAVAYGAIRQFDKALPLYEQVLELYHDELGPEHPYTITIINNLAVGYVKVGQYDKALPLFEKVLCYKIAKVGSRHPDTIDSMSNLARTYRSAGEQEKSLPLFKETLRRREAVLGPNHPDTLNDMGHLAQLYWAIQDLDQSIPLWQELLKRRESQLGEQHVDTLQTAANLAVNYKDAGRIAEALPLLEKAYDASKKQPQLRWIVSALADGYAKAGQLDKAVSFGKESLAIAREELPSDSLELGGKCASYGLICLKAEHYSEAEAILRECLAIRETAIPDSWLLFNTYSLLGGALLGQRRYQEAEPLLLKGYQGMKDRESKIPASGMIRLTESLERLVDLYQATEKEEAAVKWQAELNRRKVAASEESSDG